MSAETIKPHKKAEFCVTKKQLKAVTIQKMLARAYQRQ